jgi:hypothetical protein
LSSKELKLLEQARPGLPAELRARRSARSALRLATVALFALVEWGCGTSSPSSPALRPEEEALVDAYVQISRIEALRADAPDSVGPALDRVAENYDSTAVREALAGLRREPERWEYVYAEIARRLQAIEESPNPNARRPGTPVPRIKAP